MALPAKKPSELIVAIGKPKDGPPPKDAPVDEGDSELDPGEEAAAADAMDAAQGGDAKAFGIALKDFVSICMRKYGP